MFIDEVGFKILSGKGGDGCVSLHRERTITKGGPDGGDGGKGGDVWFEVDDSLTTLFHLRFQNEYGAKNGRPGEGKRKSGKKGEDLILKVPRGTIIREQGTEDLIVDFNMNVDRWQVLDGGKGGRGNWHFRSSTHQTPRESEPGGESEILDIQLSLKLIADVGLLGFPNAGKSSLLSRVSKARPKVANYPFTTMQPHLGTCSLGPTSQIVFADIPGLIEGASEGKGLGIQFLKHVERTKMLLHLVEPFHDDGESPVEKVKTIRKELENYSTELASRPQMLALTKLDLGVDEEEIKAWEEELGETFFRISTATGEGMTELLKAVHEKLERMND
jgi:GTP-binding protein